MRRVLLALVAVAALFGAAGSAVSFNAPTAARRADTFLAGRGSPLSGLGRQAVALGLACSRPYDGRVLIAISGAESTYGRDWGKFQPSGHNAWSWGDSVFPSYKAGLRVVGRGICNGYIKQGRTTVATIAPRYVGSASTGGWQSTVHYGMRAMGAASVLLPVANKPSTQPPKLPPVKAHGRRVGTKCASRLIQINDRGKCVRALSWLYTGSDPAKRRGRYWHVRSDVGAVFGKAMVKQTQILKYRLGFPAGKANGAAGPKFRRILLGQELLSKGYAAASTKRYDAWKAGRNKSGKVRSLLLDASYLLNAAPRVHYTQTMTGPNGRMSMLLNHPRGPPILGDLWADCSGSVEALYIWNGLPDPAGPGAWQNYPSAAVYTGSQALHGRLVWRAGQALSALRAGDLIFYGDGAPFHHVAMYIGNGRVFSHGTESCPCNNSVLYRDDAYEARRYF